MKFYPSKSILLFFVPISFLLFTSAIKPAPHSHHHLVTSTWAGQHHNDATRKIKKVKKSKKKRIKLANPDKKKVNSILILGIVILAIGVIVLSFTYIGAVADAVVCAIGASCPKPDYTIGLAISLVGLIFTLIGIGADDKG